MKNILQLCLGLSISLGITTIGSGQSFVLQEVSVSGQASLNPDAGSYLYLPGLGNGAFGFVLAANGPAEAAYTDAAGDVDVVGTMLTPGGEVINVEEANVVNGDGSCTVNLNMTTTGPDLWPTGFLVGGAAADTGAFFIGASGGGTALSWATDGPPIMTASEVELFTPAGTLALIDLSSAGVFTAGPGGSWAGSAGFSFGATSAGLGINRIDFRFSYTDTICTLLPVELSSFSSSSGAGDITLKWSTLSELNNAGFDVEYSSNGQFFQNIGYVPGAGTTTETSDYQFEIENFEPGNYQFRLKQIDFDGSYEYSEVIESVVTVPDGYLIGNAYPNPFNPSTTMQIGVETTQNVVVEIYNTSGQLVATAFEEELGANQMTSVQIRLENLPSGQYIAAVRGTNWVAHEMITMIK